MAYTLIPSHRMPYDIDGTEVAYRSNGWDTSAPNAISAGIQGWLDATTKSNLNKEDRSLSINAAYGGVYVMWFFFPELREITHLGVQFPIGGTNLGAFTIEGSTDTTNGVDGNWETATFIKPGTSGGAFFWRSGVFAVSFSGPVKCLRVCVGGTSTSKDGVFHAVHIYGMKSVGQTPDDIVFTDTDGNVLTSLKDWGDRPEGTTVLSSFKVKNASTTKIANAVNLQLNHGDYAISLSPDGPWTAVIDITSIAAGSLSSTIYVRNMLSPPLLTLGPRSARCIVTVGSWT